MAAKSKKPAPATASASASEPAAPAAPAPFSPMSLESLADLGRKNIAAMAEANLALNAGLGAIGQELLAYAKSTLADASQAATALLGAKTLDEVIELNSDLAKAAMESLIARSTKLSELGIATTNQALAPLASLARPAAA